MSLSAIKVNNNSVISVDEKPIVGSNNLVKSNGLYEEIQNRKKLFLDDSDFSLIPECLIDYIPININTNKEYYLHTCGIRNNNKRQTIIQVFDENELLEETSLDGSDEKIHEVICAGFKFIIDCSLLNNSQSIFLWYNCHLNKFAYYNFDNIPKRSSQKLLTSGSIYNSIKSCSPGMFLEDSDFSKYPYAILDIDYTHANDSLPDDIYLVTFGYRSNNPSFSLIIINDQNGDRIEQFPFDATDGDIKNLIMDCGITFTVDCSKLPIVTTSVFDAWNLHLNRNYYAIKTNVDIFKNVFTFSAESVIVSLGDSITMGNGTSDGYDYPSVMGRFLSSKVFNLGLGGTTFSTLTDSSFCKVVDSIISNDWTDIDSWIQSAVEQYPFMSYLITRYAAFKQINFSNVDIVTISYGTNDWNFGYVLDNNNNPLDTTTILGGLRYGISRLESAYPRLRIYVFSPIYRWFTKEDGSIVTDSDNTKRGAAQLMLSDISMSIYNECQKLHIPCKNMYYSSNINKYSADYFIADGTHLNTNGAQLLAEKYAKFIDSN